MSRRRARELAFRALFGAARGDEPLLDTWTDIRADLTEQTPGEAEEAYGEPLGADGLVFAERLVRTFAEHQSELDGQLSGVLEGWTFAQMSQTDLAVLRLALTELTYEDLPPEVTFEVAVRIAKRYGGEESGRFVNGVLARLHRDRQDSGVRESDARESADQNAAGQDSADQNDNVENSDIRDGKVQDGEVQADVQEKGATQNIEAPTQTHDLNVEGSTSATTDSQDEDVSAPSDAVAQSELENPDVGAGGVKNPDPEDALKDSDAQLESETDPRDRDVVGR